MRWPTPTSTLQDRDVSIGTSGVSVLAPPTSLCQALVVMEVTIHVEEATIGGTVVITRVDVDLAVDVVENRIVVEELLTVVKDRVTVLAVEVEDESERVTVVV